MKKNKIVIITPFWNPNLLYLDTCLNTILSQKYDNYKVVVIDDCSNNGSWELVSAKVGTNPNFICIRNEERKTALENIHDAIINHCTEDEIVCLLDGDDAFPNRSCLAKVNESYSNDPWIVYFQSMWVDDRRPDFSRRGFARAYTQEEYNNVKTAPFCISHLRTFRAGVYHKIVDQDPNFSCMKDKDGKFYSSAYDVCIFLPLFSLTPFEKVKFIDEIMYTYRLHGMNDHEQDQNKQTSIHIEVSQKPQFKKLTNYK